LRPATCLVHKRRKAPVDAARPKSPRKRHFALRAQFKKFAPIRSSASSRMCAPQPLGSLADDGCSCHRKDPWPAICNAPHAPLVHLSARKASPDRAAARDLTDGRMYQRRCKGPWTSSGNPGRSEPRAIANDAHKAGAKAHAAVIGPVIAEAQAHACARQRAMPAIAASPRPMNSGMGSSQRSNTRQFACQEFRANISAVHGQNGELGRRRGMKT
jgi:hypothetical protein